MKTFRSILFTAVALATVSSCSLGNPEAPPLTGVSTYFLSLTVTASPDILTEDGVSQSVIRIVARDENAQPIPNLAVRVDSRVHSGPSGRTDPGTLSAHNVTTNAAGEATIVFTAPRALHMGVDSDTTLEVRATPVSNDYAGSNPRGVLIRLVPETLATIPGAPVPSFIYSPLAPTVDDIITFNASASKDDGTIVRYRWTFSDGHQEQDLPVVSHDFATAGTYFVTLTVTDNEGKSSSVTQSIRVTCGC